MEGCASIASLAKPRLPRTEDLSGRSRCAIKEEAGEGPRPDANNTMSRMSRHIFHSSLLENFEFLPAPLHKFPNVKQTQECEIL